MATLDNRISIDYSKFQHQSFKNLDYVQRSYKIFLKH